MSIDTDLYDNSDGSLDSAVEKIMGKMAAPETPPARSAKQAARAEDVQTETDPVIEPEEGETEPAAAAADDDDELFLEIPSEEEGKEAERVRAADAIDAVKQMRQMKESVASAINKQEAQYIAEQDKVLTELKTTYGTVRERAEIALYSIPAPQPPNRVLLDQNSQYYNPERFHLMQLDYEDQVKALQHYQATATQAKQAEESLAALEAQRRGEREYTQLSRHKGFEDWSNPQKRDTLEATLVEKLGKHFGVTPADLQGVRSHKLWLLADTAIKAVETKSDAPAVRKQVKETAVRITKGQRATPERGGDGRFLGDARKELAENGSLDAFANLLMKSGALRQPSR